jgi:glucose-1-phosphate adenylyltransferase
MSSKKECIAMLLAGGQGSRLYALTSRKAKPAITYGAKYRIIDFPLSNCINSNISTVGVLTQYQPWELNEYIGAGQPWDLDRNYGGVHILPPYQGRNKSGWYKGTANAIYQNIHFIKRFNPEYVLVLSGDHIYKMDYSEIIKIHKNNNADCTIAVIEVDIKEASRFGIMSTDENGRITKFSEKPKQPESNLASMGIYVFNTKLLIDYLESDEEDNTSSNDFGKNIIPKMLKEGLRLYTYRFEGYWKDVGTLYSLWEANMDLLGDNPAFDLYEGHRKIYSRNNSNPPQYIGTKAKLENSIITEGCSVNGEVVNSIISENVIIEEGAKIINSIIFENTKIGKNAIVEYSILDANVTVCDGIKIGDKKELTVIAENINVNVDIAAGLIVEED